MEFLGGKDVYLWKNALLLGQQPRGEAARVADVLGQIHATSARSEFDRSPFQNRDDFDDLRIDPYLRFTATRHSQVAGQIMAVADAIYSNDTVLVHGDVSPKNIMLRGAVPVILDAECATMGDASFDPAFCINHLVLKAIHLPRVRSALLQEVLTLLASMMRHRVFISSPKNWVYQ
jgi:aminoglycoside phosphotransferase (APT) family kinase protein